jgi:signal transduction histidine kinase
MNLGEKGPPGKGFGLMSIRERARAIGAEMLIADGSNAGTRLEIIMANSVPVAVEADNHEDPACR